MEKIRQVIVTMVGHVDHGKTSILDNIRGSAIVSGEAGAITQAIGASIVPLEVIKKITGKLLENLKMDFTIPGLLFIDTPGHAAFTNLRKRGGNLADIAVLVVDINEGFKPQTLEAIEILKNYKTPFVVAANKIDLISGWELKEGNVLQSIQKQSEKTITAIETKLYELVGQIHKHGFESERFDRVKDYTKQIAIIPCSAKTGAGIPELLMVMAGLAQKYLEQCLKCNINGPAKGTILEVKEEKGIGKCMDVILYDGTLKANDIIVVGGMEGAIVAKVRCLFEPAPLQEMRTKKAKFKPMKEVRAATGVKISAPNTEEVVAGMPLVSCHEDNIEKCKEEVQKEIEEVFIETDKEGIIIKADTLGSLEALITLLQERDIPIRKATIGSITKKDINDAETNFEEEPLYSVILAFNVAVGQDIAVPEKVKILTNEVIYKLIESYEEWVKEQEKLEEAKKLDILIKPCRFEILRGYVFRQSNPAIVGVHILEGSINTGTDIMNKDGKIIGSVKSLQHEKESITKAERGKQVAMGITGATVGRQINEGDILFSVIPEEDFKKLKTLKKFLSKGDIEVLKQIAEIKRRDNPVWGI
ncbi:translation initiation factor IF-2 [Candidatus Woesearchaeota archaeon]|nr:translation initiation factor IF-2 [Candidatus Woesearchaeota archaeon]